MKKTPLFLALVAGCAIPIAASAQLVISDTLTGASSNYNWYSLNGACLTAGNNSGSIPACVGLPYYNGKTLVGGVTGRLSPGGDPVGQGALRLTNGDTTTGSNGNNQTGAVVSNFTFPSNQGLQVTFGTVTYGGNAFGNSSGQASGADGVTFFLADGSVLQPGTSTPATGAYGGSLGYSCANAKPYPGDEGLPGAYLAVGIDEYGNFVNGATVTQTTTTAVSTTANVVAKTGIVLTDSTGKILVDSSGNPIANPGGTPAWYGTPSTVSIGTAIPVSSSTSAPVVVTNTPPNSTTSTTPTGSTSVSANQTLLAGGAPMTGKSSCGSKNAYCMQATFYANAGTITTATTVTTNYSISNIGDNTASNASMLSASDTSGPHPGRISVRGSGNVNFAWLNSTYPTLFPIGMSASAIQTAISNTCATGFPYNNTGSSQTVNGTVVPAGGYYPQAVADYPLLGTSQLPAGNTIYNQEATNMPLRGKATPITYSLSITQNGLLNMSYSYNGGSAVPVIKDQSIAASNGAVPANLRFGFSAGTGGGSNVHELTCFKAAALNSASTSAGVNVQQSAQVQEGTQVYLAYYHPTNWWGQLTATSLAYNATTDTVSLATLSNWDASCVLTGGSCSATGGSNTAEPSGTGSAGTGTRQLMTWGGGAGVPFQWSSLSAAQQNALDAADTMPGSPNADRLGWLRGDRINEIGYTGSGAGSDQVFRRRDGVLGDIVDSSPTWVGPPQFPYKGPWVDALNPSVTQPEGTTYATFASTNATRTNVVYSGANDGFMHAFRAGAYTSAGVFDTTATNDGRELMAYMPSAVLSTIHGTTSPTPPSGTNPNLDFSSPSYSHALSVDATPGFGDLYYNGGWHTWLVGGLGPGGNAGGPIGDNTSTATGGDIFAIDITNPGNFSEGNAGNLVIGDWGATNNANGSTPITCVSNTPANCGNNLGNTYGTPIIRRLHDGKWGVIFGNGFNSQTGTAGVFIMEVDSAGAITFRFLDTGYGPSKDPLGAGNKNGIAYVSSADLDGDHITDYLYAGDRFGNVWRFDLTSSNPANWAAGATPLFSTPGGQPITTRVTVSAAGSGGTPRVMVDFATGQKLPQTLTSAATFAAGTQSIYGIWDWNMNAWNAMSSTRYASLTAPQSVTSANLQTQTATDVAVASGDISGVRTVTQNKVCWSGSLTCGTAASANTQFGWKLALPESDEQVVYNPASAYGLFVVNTTIPAVNQILSCNAQPPTGYTMAITTDTGGAPTSSFFSSATNTFYSAAGAIVSGIGLSAVGSPSFVTAMTKPFMVNQTVSGVGSVTQVNPGANGRGARLNWIELR